MSTIEVAIAHQNPIAVFEETPLEINVVDQNTILVESSPIVGVVQYAAVKGDPGTDGVSPDFADPATVADMLLALSGQITNTQLHSDLLLRVDKIDVGPTSLEAQASLLAYADSQLNASIAQDALRITANESAITVIDGQITSLGSDLTTLDGRVTGNSAAVDSLTTRVTAAESDLTTQAQQVTGISSRVDIVEDNQTAQAAIVNQNTTTINNIDGELTSTAQTLSTITAGVGGMAAAIALEAQVIAGTATPLFAQYTVKVDVNGKISGFGLSSTETSSMFEILADRFAVTNGLNSGIIPFIVDGANVYIQNGFIQNAAIDSAKIADASITTAKIVDANITTAKIAAANITNALIADAAITTAKIANAAITNAQIADAQINTAKIVDGTITTAKIANAQITNALISDAAITSAKIQDASIVNGDIANATITGAKIASATIGTANIATGNITNALIADAAITSAKIADANITTAKIADAQITTLKIGGNQVTLPVGSSASAEVYDAAGTTILSVSFSCVGQPVLLNACVQVKAYSGTAGNYRIVLYADSTAVFDTGASTVYVSSAYGSQVVNVSGLISVSAGMHTFSVWGQSSPDSGADCSFLNRTLVATELRR